MNKFLIPLMLILLSGSRAFSSAKTDSLLAVLKTELTKEITYDNKKELRIANLRGQLASTFPTDYAREYAICGKLYEEYKVYKFDSAYVYAQKLFVAAKNLKDASKQNETQIKLGFILLSAGMFKETFDCLNVINGKSLGDSSRLEFYGLKARAYADLGEYNNDKYYASNDYSLAVKYIDSVLMLAKPGSYDMLDHLGDRQIRLGQTGSPSTHLTKLLYHYALSEHQKAIVATGLSLFYAGTENRDKRIELLALAAINDIRSSTKETLALFKLGEELDTKGDVLNSYIFIQKAMSDAQYYGARLRKVKIGAVLPIIAAKKLIMIENDKRRFLIYSISISTIAIIISLVSFIVFYQLRRLKVKEKIIEDKNIELERINGRLTEDTRIKEEYIGNFFNIISGYILMLEKLKRSTERKLAGKKYDEILASINEINIKKEREDLFHTFDHIFLKIFPNFITVFNSMLKPEDQLWPKDHEVLNTDLRIFALLRLGINDNQAIANILEYSVNTIYVYKMRIKAKAIISSDQFDQTIMSVRAVDTPAYRS